MKTTNTPPVAIPFTHAVDFLIARHFDDLVDAEVSNASYRLKTHERAEEARRRLISVLDQYQKTWEKRHGAKPNIEAQDVHAAMNLILKQDLYTVQFAIHYYVCHFSGYWADRGEPLHGLERCWNEVFSHRTKVISDPYNGPRSLVRCGCYREPVAEEEEQTG